MNRERTSGSSSSGLDKEVFLSAAESEREGGVPCLDSLGSLKHVPSGSKNILNMLSRKRESAEGQSASGAKAEEDPEAGLDESSISSEESQGEKLSHTSIEKKNAKDSTTSAKKNDTKWENEKVSLHDEEDRTMIARDENAKENMGEDAEEGDESAVKTTGEGADSNPTAAEDEQTAQPAQEAPATPRGSAGTVRTASARRDSLVAELVREGPSADQLRASVAKEFSSRIAGENGKEYDLFWSTVGLLRRYEDPMRPSASRERHEAAASASDSASPSTAAAEGQAAPDEVAAAIDAIDALFPGADLDEADEDEEDAEDEPGLPVELQRDDAEEPEQLDDGAESPICTFRRAVAGALGTDQPGDDQAVPYLEDPAESTRKRSLGKRLRKFLSKTLGLKKKPKSSEETDVTTSDVFQP